MFDIAVDLDVSLLVAALDRIPASLDARREPMRAAFDKASAALMRWEEGRFVSASGLDGTWRDIAPVTKYERLKKQAKVAGAKKSPNELLRVAASAAMPILYVTGTLQAGLFTRGSSGHFVEFDEEGVSEGVRGGAHPDAPISVGELAFDHHYGNPARRLPARPVMGQPEGEIVTQVLGALTEGVNAAFDSLASSLGGGLAAA